MAMSPRLLRPRASRSVAGYDAAAAAYFLAVEAADGQALETQVKTAINSFVVGCKADGIWSAIKASCILMGARTLSGALTPLVGSAPTNNNFVSGDYNRKTGLIGNGTSKYLNTGYAWSGTTLDDRHLSVYASSIQTNANNLLIGSTRTAAPASNVPRHQILHSVANPQKLASRLADETSVTSVGNLYAAGFIGGSRSASASYTLRGNATNETITQVSVPGTEMNVWVYARELSGSELFTSSSLAFYSAGNAITLSSLDSRVTTLYNAIGAAIP